MHDVSALDCRYRCTCNCIQIKCFFVFIFRWSWPWQSSMTLTWVLSLRVLSGGKTSWTFDVFRSAELVRLFLLIFKHIICCFLLLGSYRYINHLNVYIYKTCTRRLPLKKINNINKYIQSWSNNEFRVKKLQKSNKWASIPNLPSHYPTSPKWLIISDWLRGSRSYHSKVA